MDTRAPHDGTASAPSVEPDERNVEQSGGLALSAHEIPPLREAMRDLQVAVSEYYAETARGGDLGPPVRRFLVAAQTVNDLLTNGITDAQAYRDLFGGLRGATAELIDAVRFARNVTQHVLHIVRPSDRVNLVGGAFGMRLYALWDHIPAEVVAKLRPATQRLEPAYVSTLEGHEVTGTMLSVVRFFARVAPEIVHRDALQEWTGFPLLSQPGMNTPIHPEEPADLPEARQWMDSRPPGGDCRVVLGQVSLEGIPYVFGHTFTGRLSFAPFVETAEQMRRDIAMGFSYLTGDLSANFDEVTDRFPEALQGAVLESRGPVTSWASPLTDIEPREDWRAPGIDLESWTRVVELETDVTLPDGFTFGPRRARRLNALVPPNVRGRF